MLQELLQSLNDPNGVTQDMWLHILSFMGEEHPALKNAQIFGGRTYLIDAQKNAIRSILPFATQLKPFTSGLNNSQLVLPAHEPELEINCRKCGQVTTRLADGGFMAYTCTTQDCSYKDIKIRYTIEKILRCSHCTGPFHPATGHTFNSTIVACGVCYGRFICWQMQKYGWRPLSKKQRNKLAAKRKKQQKADEKMSKELLKKIARENAEWERLYGKARKVQSEQSHILE